MNNIKTTDSVKFKALMAYLNPIGLIGFNVDMWMDHVIDFPEDWITSNLDRFKPIEIFSDYIKTIILNLGDKLYHNINKDEQSFWVDVTINPKTREIRLSPKYYTNKDVEDDDKHFDWSTMTDYDLLSIFKNDNKVNSLNIEYSAVDGNFYCRIYYNDTKHEPNLTMFYKSSVYHMLSELLGDNWAEEGGAEGLLELHRENNSGHLYNTWNIRTIANGEQIILTQ